jgi:hypothetical protein
MKTILISTLYLFSVLPLFGNTPDWIDFNNKSNHNVLKHLNFAEVQMDYTNAPGSYWNGDMLDINRCIMKSHEDTIISQSRSGEFVLPPSIRLKTPLSKLDQNWLISAAPGYVILVPTEVGEYTKWEIIGYSNSPILSGHTKILEPVFSKKKHYSILNDETYLNSHKLIAGTFTIHAHQLENKLISEITIHHIASNFILDQGPNSVSHRIELNEPLPREFVLYLFQGGLNLGTDFLFEEQTNGKFKFVGYIDHKYALEPKSKWVSGLNKPALLNADSDMSSIDFSNGLYVYGSIRVKNSLVGNTRIALSYPDFNTNMDRKYMDYFELDAPVGQSLIDWMKATNKHGLLLKETPNKKWKIIGYMTLENSMSHMFPGNKFKQN